jgi:hypothetical protein
MAGDAGKLVESLKLRIDGEGFAEPLGERRLDLCSRCVGRGPVLHRVLPTKGVYS